MKKKQDPTIVLDPNTLSNDGTRALSSRSLSEGKTDNLFFAYGISTGGSDWMTIHVLDVEKGTTCDDTVQFVKFSSIAWMHDDSGFFYARFPNPKGYEKGDDMEKWSTKQGTETEANINHQIWFHKLGSTQEDDVFIFAYPKEPTFYVGAEVSDCGTFLILYIREGCKNATMMSIADLSSGISQNDVAVPLKITDVITDMEFNYEYVLNNGNEFFFQTNANAPREKLVKCTLTQNGFTGWKDIIPEPSDAIVLESVVPVGEDRLIVRLLVDVKHVVNIYDLEGNVISDIELPDIGTVIVSARRYDPEWFFKFTSFVTPSCIFRLSLKDDVDIPPVKFRETALSGVDTSIFATEQVFYTSKDGTKVPMFLVGKKEILKQRNGDTATYLYGYGGFNISLKPSFSVFRIAFMQHFNGLIAIPNLRGGAEYGEEWHAAGTYGRKQNVFDDFIGAAEFLIQQKFTNPSKLAIHGGSNGGLLVAACANQRPELFACAVAAVGVLDMLRFHKFTCGAGWRSDYGDPDVADQFPYLHAYSPLHNIPSDVIYPSTLLTTGDHDDRVVPLHSYKFISELQHKLGKVPDQNPLLIRIETQAGHGAGKPTSKILAETAQVYAFMAHAMKQPYVN